MGSSKAFSDATLTTYEAINTSNCSSIFLFIPGLSMRSKREGRNFRKDIEGLRAVAVLLVVGYHIGVPGLSGGFLGVDVFFVLSGYLITGLLVGEIERDGLIDIRKFYARRIRRLLPAAGLMIAATAIAAFLLYSPIEQGGLARGVAATSVYMSNFLFLKRAINYFAAPVESSALLHTWSLAVEEQFYIVWPFFIAFLFRAGQSRKKAAYGIFAVFVISFAICIWLTHVHQPWAFFSSPPRAWEFAVGGLAVLVPVADLERFRGMTHGLGYAGLASILLCGIYFSASLPLPGALMLIPALGTAVLLLSGQSAGARTVGSLLSIAPLQFIGRVSYSWYLWHWPTLVFVKLAVPHWSVFAALFCGFFSLGLATLTFVVLEQPVRSSLYFSRGWLPNFVMAALIMSGGLALAGGLLLSAHRVERSPQARAIIRAATTLPEAYARHCFLDLTGTAPRECHFGNENSAMTVVLFGDSHAAQWFSAIKMVADAHGWRLLTFLKAACPPADIVAYHQELKRQNVECPLWRSAVLREIRAIRPQITFVAGAHGYFIGTDKGPSYADWQQGTFRTLEYLKQAGTRIVMLRDTPEPGVNIPDCLLRASSAIVKLMQRCDFARASAVDGKAFLAERAAVKTVNSSSLLFVDLMPYFCDGDACSAMRDGIVVYRDSDHISDEYARHLSSRLEQALAPFLGAK